MTTHEPLQSPGGRSLHVVQLPNGHWHAQIPLANDTAIFANGPDRATTMQAVAIMESTVQTSPLSDVLSKSAIAVPIPNASLTTAVGTERGPRC